MSKNFLLNPKDGANSVFSEPVLPSNLLPEDRIRQVKGSSLPSKVF